MLGRSRIAGHSAIAISRRYIHPSEDAVLNAMARLGGAQNWTQSSADENE